MTMEAAKQIKPNVSKKNKRQPLNCLKPAKKNELIGPGRQSDTGQIAADDFVYEVAFRAWKRGMSVPSIAKDLGFPGDAAMITKVKRALLKASASGILVLNQPKLTDYHEKLSKKWPRVDFTIVRNNLLAKDDAIHIAASDVLAEKITELWNESEDQVVIANAGGHAVSETVRYLHQRIGPVLDPHPEKRLVFISLNSAGRARRFQQSSNYLAVQLAGIYGAEHIAVLGPADANVDHLYESIDLLVCGAGGPTSLLVQRAREEAEEKNEEFKLPPEMVGDIAFIPLDKKGRPIRNPRLQTIIEDQLHAAPPYDEILRIVAQPPRTVLVVLSGESKLPIARALLAGGLLSHVIMDIALAKCLCGNPANATKT